MLLSVFFGDSAVPRSVIDHSSDTVSGDKLILETDSDDMSMPSDDEIVCEAHKNSTKRETKETWNLHDHLFLHDTCSFWNWLPDRPQRWSIFRAMWCRWFIFQQWCDTDYFWKSLTSPPSRLFSFTIGNDYFSIILLILGPIILGLFTICPPISTQKSSLFHHLFR